MSNQDMAIKVIAKAKELMDLPTEVLMEKAGVPADDPQLMTHNELVEYLLIDEFVLTC